MDIKEAIKLFIRKDSVGVKMAIKEPIKAYMKVRKTLGGDYMIYDHPLYDIVILPKKNKIVTFSRKNSNVDPYSSQDKFFNHLTRRGVILPDTVQGGNVHGSLEATYPINDEQDTIQILFLCIYNFLKDEIQSIKDALAYSDEVEELYTEPSDEDSTELGEVPHAEKKGSIDPNYKPYGLIYRL